jgi:NTE family protein
MENYTDPEPNLTPQSHTEARTRRQPFTVAGTGFALALGGGFSRGFAHLGVLEVLEEERIPITMIVGSSIGSLLGAAYADGISIPELCEYGSQVRVRDFLRYQSVSPEALNGTPKKDRISRFVSDWFQARQIEDLAIPTAIVTTDMDTGAPHVFTHGPLDVAIRASCAFPGLFKPVEHNGRRLVDGCIAAPVPTALAAQTHNSYVLGVAVSSYQKGAASGRNVVQVFNQAFSALHKRMLLPLWARGADILLEPEVNHIVWSDFRRVDEARAAGAEAMRRALPYVRKMLDQRPQLGRVPENSGLMESGMAS